MARPTILGRRLVVAVAAMSLLVLAARPAFALTAPVLSVGTITQTSVAVSWTDAGNEQQYRIYRDSVLITTLGANVLTYTHVNLTPATTYTFRVDAKKGGQVLASNTVSATTQSPPPPQPPTVTGFTPDNGPVGTGVTLTGTNFTTATAVEFNGTSASFSVTSDTVIATSVPTGATTGSISVTNPAGTGTSASNFTVTAPPPPSGCTDVVGHIDVPFNATVGYLNMVIPGNGAQTYCLAAGTYEMGSTTSLHYDSGDVIWGQPVTFGPNGEVTAPTAIHSTAGASVIEAQAGDATLTVTDLDICCSPYVDNAQTGRGIDGANATLVTLAVTNSRIHGNGQSGIGGVGPGLDVENSEIDHNGTGHGGTDAGIKTVNYMVVRNSYIHDNSINGLWWDCDAPGGIVSGNTINVNANAGVEVEISSGNAASGKAIPTGATYGFTIGPNNHVEGNNTTSTAPYAGILASGSANVNADGNTTINNNLHNILFTDNGRSGLGHHGCSSGFFASEGSSFIENNQYGPLDVGDCTLAGVTCLNNTKIL